MQDEIKTIIKRDGREVPFDVSRKILDRRNILYYKKLSIQYIGE